MNRPPENRIWTGRRTLTTKSKKGDLCYTLFTEKGFEWGGDWTDRKDYQHFELPSEITEKYSEMYGGH